MFQKCVHISYYVIQCFYRLAANVCKKSFAYSHESIVNLDKIKKSIEFDNFWAFNLIKDIEKGFKVLKK